MIFLHFFIYTVIINIEPLDSAVLPVNQTRKLFNNFRRILGGHEVGDTRPYMVYLMPPNASKANVEDNWLCGGAIIDSRFIITSAACIEEVDHFYVISGTHRWAPMSDKDNECVKNGRKKAVWKCVSKSYVFDGKEFDNIQWMANDLAVVKVEDNFNFEKRVRGCDFIPKMIAYNNISVEMEKPGTIGSIAGWGATEKFYEANLRTSNSPVLLETDVKLISSKNCKKKWPERYHRIIDNSMVCTKDEMDMNALCKDQGVNCKDMENEDEYDTEEQEKEGTKTRKQFVDDLTNLRLHSAAHTETRRTKPTLGGFCENDHGGPLVVGQGATAVVVGVISACLTKELTQKCHGPFLFTSVWKLRNLIDCAIHKDSGTCQTFLRTNDKAVIETKYDWDHPDGLMKPDVADDKQPKNSTATNGSLQ